MVVLLRLWLSNYHHFVVVWRISSQRLVATHTLKSVVLFSYTHSQKCCVVPPHIVLVACCPYSTRLNLIETVLVSNLN